MQFIYFNLGFVAVSRQALVYVVLKYIDKRNKIRNTIYILVNLCNSLASVILTY